MRREIEHALARERNIIKLLGPGFTWPSAAELPHELHLLNTLEQIEFDNKHWQEERTGPRSKLLKFLKRNASEVRKDYETNARKRRRAGTSVTAKA